MDVFLARGCVGRAVRGGNERGGEVQAGKERGRARGGVPL